MREDCCVHKARKGWLDLLQRERRALSLERGSHLHAGKLQTCSLGRRAYRVVPRLFSYCQPQRFVPKVVRKVLPPGGGRSNVCSCAQKCL